MRIGVLRRLPRRTTSTKAPLVQVRIVMQTGGYLTVVCRSCPTLTSLAMAYSRNNLIGKACWNNLMKRACSMKDARAMKRCKVMAGVALGDSFVSKASFAAPTCIGSHSCHMSIASTPGGLAESTPTSSPGVKFVDLIWSKQPRRELGEFRGFRIRSE